jgi:hypothetical protein
MEKAKRARTAETPKQPSLCLRLRAPYFYPDRAYSASPEMLTMSISLPVFPATADSKEDAAARRGRSSRAEELHLRALPEPYVNLSIHTAPDVRPFP